MILGKYPTKEAAEAAAKKFRKTHRNVVYLLKVDGLWHLHGLELKHPAGTKKGGK